MAEEYGGKSVRMITISLGINLVATAVAYRFGGEKAALSIFILGLVLIALGWFWPRQSKPQISPPLPAQQNEQHVVANPQQIVNIGLDIPRAHAPIPVPMPTEPKQVEQPDIKFLPSEERPLSDFDQYAPALAALVACLRNDSIHGTRSDFAAHVIYKDPNGNEVTDMGRGLWLSSISSTVIRFPTGITQRLAIFLSSKGGELSKPVVERRQERLAGKQIILSEIAREKFRIQIAAVEIRLLREGKPPIIFNLAVERVGGKVVLIEKK